MAANIDASNVARDLYNQWAAALRAHSYDWFERHLSEDYMFSAHPFPDMRLDKATFIEVDKKIGAADIRFVSVEADLVDEIIISRVIADVKEEFKADLGAGLPSAAEVNRLFSGERFAYVSAWRKTGNVWQCFDHHMIGAVR